MAEIRQMKVDGGRLWNRLETLAGIGATAEGGISHSPLEYSSPADVLGGANVLLEALLSADRGCLPLKKHARLG